MQREHIPIPIVFMDDDAAEARFEEQYLRDLATLDRIEHQNECFFVVMGELHHNKALQMQQEKIGEGDAA